MFSSPPKHSGIYSVKDKIENLQIKICLRPINTLLNLPKYNVPNQTNKESVKTNKTKTRTNLGQNDETVTVIKWQQKLFSSAECELYSDVKNCSNEQQRGYHAILKEQDRRKRPAKKKRQRKQGKTQLEAATDQGNLIFTYVHQDNFSNGRTELDKNMKGEMKRFEEEPCEEMFVYAALHPDTQLAVLRWFKQQRLLYIYPDFTGSENQPYIIEIDSDYRHLYSYGLKDVSLKAMSSAQDQAQFVYLPELPTHWRVEDEIGRQFSMPPKRTQRCAIIFAINSVCGFEYENIHIRFRTKLPENVILEEGLLDATTHATSSGVNSTDLHMGFSWQITLLCEEQFDPCQYLRLFCEVISIDSWERERIEGYAHYSLKLLQPCHHIVKLNCVRPAETLLESLNRYFIGGRRKFNYERFVSEADSNFHCRYGERMQNSGQISLTCEVLTQRNCELLNPCPSRTSGMTLDDIMMAYKEARRRLEAASLH